MVMGTNQDMTFCINEKCEFKKCPVHASHINWSYGPPFRSYADFEGTRYCKFKPRKENKS